MTLPSLRVIGLVAALCFLAGSIGWVIGQGRPPGEDSADVGFLQDMIRHHEQAITMSEIELANGTTEDIRLFAREILLFQSYEIGLMDEMLRDWGYSRGDGSPTAMAWMGHPTDVASMPGMASEEDLEQLRAASGPEADSLFLTLVQDHHRGGVAMSEAATKTVDDGAVRALAERFARNQRAEIADEAARDRAGLP